MVLRHRPRWFAAGIVCVGGLLIVAFVIAEWLRGAAMRPDPQAGVSIRYTAVYLHPNAYQHPPITSRNCAVNVGFHLIGEPTSKHSAGRPPNICEVFSLTCGPSAKVVGHTYSMRKYESGREYQLSRHGRTFTVRVPRGIPPGGRAFISLGVESAKLGQHRVTATGYKILPNGSKVYFHPKTATYTVRRMRLAVVGPKSLLLGHPATYRVEAYGLPAWAQVQWSSSPNVEQTPGPAISNGSLVPAGGMLTIMPTRAGTGSFSVWASQVSANVASIMKQQSFDFYVYRAWRTEKHPGSKLLPGPWKKVFGIVRKHGDAKYAIYLMRPIYAADLLSMKGLRDLSGLKEALGIQTKPSPIKVFGTAEPLMPAPRGAALDARIPLWWRPIFQTTRGIWKRRTRRGQVFSGSWCRRIVYRCMPAQIEYRRHQPGSRTMALSQK